VQSIDTAMKHRFIVLDGVEGCGKSTQVDLLATALRSHRVPVVVTQEPGGTPVGVRIRELLLDRRHPEMTALTEALLFCADRTQHVAQIISPALEAGKIVISDRFAASTAAYQGYAGGLGFELFDRINSAATGELLPDMTIILDIEPSAGLERKFGADTGQGDRIEQKSLEFHRLVREGFTKYAKRLGERACVLDADRPPDLIHQAILDLLGLE